MLVDLGWIGIVLFLVVGPVLVVLYPRSVWGAVTMGAGVFLLGLAVYSKGQPLGLFVMFLDLLVLLVCWVRREDGAQE